MHGLLKLTYVHLLKNGNMKFIIPSILIFLFFSQWTENVFIYANNENDTWKILELKRQGWEVFEKQSNIEKRPGIKPYENLKRLVQVVKYKLNKDKKVLFCILEYDSQLDRIMTECNSVAEKINISF